MVIIKGVYMIFITSVYWFIKEVDMVLIKGVYMVNKRSLYGL